MKKFLLVLTLFVSIAAMQKANAQCTVSDIVITPKNIVPGSNSCTITVDVAFTTATNSGSKFVYFHIWKNTDYPTATMNTEYNCTPGGNQSVAKIPVRNPNSGPNPNSQEIDVLDNAFINYGFNINTVDTTFGTAGLFSDYNVYDPTVPLLTSGTLIRKQNLGADLDRIFIQNLTFVVTNYNCGDPLKVTGFLWATNSQGNKPQCWTCGIDLLFNDPQVAGLVNCSNPRSFNLAITSSSTTGLDGTYTVFKDNLPLNSFGPEDYDVDNNNVEDAPAASGTFLGLTNLAPKTFLNQSYTGANISEESTKSLWVVVKITTPNVQANAIVQLIGNTCNTLPVSLKNFNASKRTGKVAVTWETESEINNDGFEIQRRIGNGAYKTIAFVDSKAPGGNSNGAQISYSFDDAENLPNGVAYYRLRQVDLDGKSIYSEIKAVRSNSKALFISVYPNPSRGTTNVAIPEGVGVVDVALEDFTGKLVQRWNGLNTRNLQLTNLKPGMYMLRVNARESGEQVVERILIQ